MASPAAYIPRPHNWYALSDVNPFEPHAQRRFNAQSLLQQQAFAREGREDEQAEQRYHVGMTEVDRFREDIVEGRYGAAQSRLPVLDAMGWEVEEIPGGGGVSNYRFKYRGHGDPVQQAVRQEAATANPAAAAGQAAGRAAYTAGAQAAPAAPEASFEEQLVQQGEAGAQGYDPAVQAQGTTPAEAVAQARRNKGIDPTTPQQAVNAARQAQGMPTVDAEGAHSDGRRPRNIPWHVSPGNQGPSPKGDQKALDKYFEQLAEQELSAPETAQQVEMMPDAPPPAPQLAANSILGNPVQRAIQTDRIEQLKQERIAEFRRQVENGRFGPEAAAVSKALGSANLTFENYYKKMAPYLVRPSIERAAAARKPGYKFTYVNKQQTKRDASKDFKDFWKSRAEPVVDAVAAGEEALHNIQANNYIQSALAVRKLIKASGDARPSDKDIAGMTTGTQRSDLLKFWDYIRSNAELTRDFTAEQRKLYAIGLRNIIDYTKEKALERYEQAKIFYSEAEMQSEKDQIGRLIRTYFPKHFWEKDKELQAPSYAGQAPKTTEPGETVPQRPRKTGKKKTADERAAELLEGI